MRTASATRRKPMAAARGVLSVAHQPPVRAQRRSRPTQALEPLHRRLHQLARLQHGRRSNSKPQRRTARRLCSQARAPAPRRPPRFSPISRLVDRWRDRCLVWMSCTSAPKACAWTSRINVYLVNLTELPQPPISSPRPKYPCLIVNISRRDRDGSKPRAPFRGREGSRGARDGAFFACSPRRVYVPLSRSPQTQTPSLSCGVLTCLSRSPHISSSLSWVPALL